MTFFSISAVQPAGSREFTTKKLRGIDIAVLRRLRKEHDNILFMASRYIADPLKEKDQIVFDRVTQTLEREFFEYLLDLEVKKAVRYLYFFSLMILQKIEPLQGLTEAEEEVLLRRLATLVREEIRGTDIIGRIGQDKFFIILDQADSQASLKVGERIRDRVEHYAFRVDGHEVMLKLGIGVACFPTHASDLENLIEKAERALDIAKEGGGGRVSLPE